jgi:hypothetical protein
LSTETEIIKALAAVDALAERYLSEANAARIAGLPGSEGNRHKAAQRLRYAIAFYVPAAELQDYVPAKRFFANRPFVRSE